MPDGNPEALLARVGADQDQALQFLPVNRPDSPPQARRRRAYQSCEPCRKRKTRCVPDRPGQRQPCRRCVVDEKPCDFRSVRAPHRWSAPRQAQNVDAETSLPAADARNSDQEVRSVGSRGTPRLEQGRPDGPSGHQQDSAGATNPTPSTSYHAPHLATPSYDSQSLASRPTARSRIMSAQLHTTADALDLLTFTAIGEQGRFRQHQDGLADSADPHARKLAPEDPVATNARGPRFPQASGDDRWDRFVLIKTAVLSRRETIEYLDFYFETLWPLRPVVPQFYRSKDHYADLAADEPMLLVGLVTLASRYHPLSGSHGEIRSERIHWQAWRLLKRYIESALWGSPHSRSPGSIAAMMLLIEWHPKSINNPTAFNEDAYLNSNEPANPRDSWDAPLRPPTSLTSQQRYTMTKLLEDLNIVAPAYRSNKMSWMLNSTAIGLAQEGCCFDHDSQPKSGHQGGLSPDSPREELRQQWNHLICVFLYLSDEYLAMRQGLAPLLPDGPSDSVRTRLSTSFASFVPDSAIWDNYYDLYLEVRKARIMHQTLKKTGWPKVGTLDFLQDLEHIERALERWNRQTAYTSPSDSKLLNATLEIEYHYAIMYCFSPASFVSHNPSTKQLGEQKQSSLSRLADKASAASRQILSIVIRDLDSAQLTKFLPVRCWFFIVAANLHLLKTTLTSNPTVTESDEKIQLLRSSIAAISAGSPDDTHMAMRFSQFLEILLNASMQSSRGDSPATECHPNLDQANPTSATQEQNWDASMPQQQQPPPPPPSFTPHLDSLQFVDFNYGLVSPADPLQWWEGTFGAGAF